MTQPERGTLVGNLHPCGSLCLFSRTETVLKPFLQSLGRVPATRRCTWKLFYKLWGNVSGLASKLKGRTWASANSVVSLFSCCTLTWPSFCGTYSTHLNCNMELDLDTCTGFSAEEEEDDNDISQESPTEHPSVFSCLPATLECLADSSDSCFLQFESCPMEESWFITPPPCFTAGGLTTIKVETSPLENLLIEHPSMSVYAVHNPCPGLSEASCGTDEFHNPSSPRYIASLFSFPQQSVEHAFCALCYTSKLSF